MAFDIDLNDLADELDKLEKKLSESDTSFGPWDQARLFILKDLEESLGNTLEECAQEEPLLIARDGWEEYCKEMADGCGYIDNSSINPLINYIDWEKWADSCADDYSVILFEGDEYMYRDY